MANVQGGKIGDQYFTALEGPMDPTGVQLMEITRPGVNGVAYKQLGSRGRPSQLRGLALVSSQSAAATLITTYKSLIGTTVTIVHRGQNWTPFLVLDVMLADQPRTSPQSVGGISSAGSDVTGAAVIVETVWTVQYG
ncbi:MAG: hypothetical protein J5I93_15945, partial [Pirellulaceae bacterium]|nr:hypothetical protein [Pirellulaceae bacterium]